MAYIKVRKYKEALLDCQVALYINPEFAKAHLRAFTCYLNTGDLKNAFESVTKAFRFGEASAKDKVAFVEQLIAFETFAVKALENGEWREAISYTCKIMEHAPDSMKHLALRLEAMINATPDWMTDCITLTTKV